MRSKIALSLTLALCITLAAGCTAPRTPRAEKRDDSLLNVPGVYERSDGSVTAVGLLIRIDDGNGAYWALVDRSANPLSSALPPVVAVISNPDEEFYTAQAGSLLAMYGTASKSSGDLGKADGLVAEGLAVLGPDQSAVSVAREAALENPGVYATQDGRLIAVGETCFYDTSTPGERIWALRYPAQDPLQMGVAFIAALTNHAELTLGDGLVAVEGPQVEDVPGSIGLPRIHVERVLDAGELEGTHSVPTTATILEAEPPRDAPGFVDLVGARRLAPPGIRDLPSGRTQVIGVLQSRGDVWQVVTRLPEAGAEPESEPVVLEDMDRFQHMPIENLEGDYVVAEGTLDSAESANPTAGNLHATSLDRIENVIIYPQGKSLRGIPYRWARIEKPGLFEIDNDRVRVVGMLGRGGPDEPWQVADKMPFSPGLFGSVAYLEDGFEPSGNPEDWYSTYVAVEGTRIGEIHRHGLGAGEPASAIVRVDSIERIPVPEFAIEERFH